MNEMNDWFPKGEDAWGNSSISSSSKKWTEEEALEYELKMEKEYQEWLKETDKFLKLNFSFLVRAFEEGKL